MALRLSDLPVEILALIAAQLEGGDRACFSSSSRGLYPLSSLEELKLIVYDPQQVPSLSRWLERRRRFICSLSLCISFPYDEHNEDPKREHWAARYLVGSLAGGAVTKLTLKLSEGQLWLGAWLADALPGLQQLTASGGQYTILEQGLARLQSLTSAHIDNYVSHLFRASGTVLCMPPVGSADALPASLQRLSLSLAWDFENPGNPYQEPVRTEQQPQLPRMAGLTELCSLHLCSYCGWGQLGDAVRWGDLEQLPSLTSLNVACKEMGGRLRQLEALTQLRQLSLGAGTPPTGAMRGPLQLALPNLVQLQTYEFME